MKEKRRDIESSLRVLRRKQQRSNKYFALKSSSATTPKPCTESSEVDLTQEATPLGDTSYEATTSTTDTPYEATTSTTDTPYEATTSTTSFL